VRDYGRCQLIGPSPITIIYLFIWQNDITLVYNASGLP
jgi:hypothetical protein